jgi:hypothetical protein
MLTFQGKRTSTTYLCTVDFGDCRGQVGEKCFKPTDSSRGFGYWTSCDKVYAFVIARQPTIKISNAPDLDVDRAADGGGGDGGGGNR